MQRAAASGWTRDAAAVAAAALGLIAAFPPLGVWPLAWVAPVPLLWRASAVSPRRSLLLGAVWGSLFFSFALYWIQPVLVTYGGVSPLIALAPVALLVTYCAGYFALFLWSVSAGVRRWGHRALWLAPALWVGLEWFRSHAFGGFPWAPLAISLQGVPVLMAPAAWGGAYALSALIVAFWIWLIHLVRLSSNPGACFRLGAAGAGGLVLLLVFGAWRTARLDRLPADLRVACLQVNVPQAIKWSRAHRLEILRAHRELTREAALGGARLVIWPESSLSFGPFEKVPVEEGGQNVEAWVAEQARANGVEILWGGVAAERTLNGIEFRNSAYFTAASGETQSRYDKVHLVPFGEYVPLQKYLKFVEPLVQQVGDFGPGKMPVLHPGAAAPIASIICYELLFPHLVREAAVGAGLMVNITNDAWYGTRVMPHQHLAAAPLRAVENGMAVVRAANTGVSALVSPSGRVLARTRLEERTILLGDIPSRGVDTFYRRYGDLWAGACAMISAVYFGMLAMRLPRPAARRNLQSA